MTSVLTIRAKDAEHRADLANRGGFFGCAAPDPGERDGAKVRSKTRRIIPVSGWSATKFYAFLRGFLRSLATSRSPSARKNHHAAPESFSLLRGWAIAMISMLFTSSTLLAQTGDVTAVHDPSIIQSNGAFYIFSTARGLSVRKSTDLFHWQRQGRALEITPAWTRQYIPPFGGLWAPDISFTDGEYRLYYAVSAFGKTASAIGLSVNRSLDPANATYRWVDRGKVIETPAGNDWNAIDPCAFEDEDKNSWLVLGSCWSGLKLVRLDRKTGLLADASQPPISLATNPPTNIIEEGYIRHHGDFYYLWESVDHCCRGVESNYRILIGRSKTVEGPYLDRDSKPMLRGGGTLVLASYDKVRGPGSCAIITASGKDYLIHHEYDAANRGSPTLQIRQLFWNDDSASNGNNAGWPVAGEPIRRPPSEKPTNSKSIPGTWLIRYDYGEAKQFTLSPTGEISPGNDTWKSASQRLTLTHSVAAKTSTETYTISEEGDFFVGRTNDGQVIYGSKLAAQP